MHEYHKIQSLYQRDERGRMQWGEFSMPVFAYLATNQWTFTEKVDGTNIRVRWFGLRPDDQAIEFGGKTDNAQLPATLVTVLRATFPPVSLRTVFGDANACLYGEGYGAKIQKGGGLYRPDQSFVLFDVRVGTWWLERANVTDVASRLAVEEVPVIDTGTLRDLHTIVSRGFVSRWGEFPAEGLVARPTEELLTRSGQRVITKLKHKDFRDG